MNENQVLRCAIYTRKSTEEGLEQEFNSLQAQREAAEAYVLSQRQAGWIALPEVYADGGFSGATLERPALSRLLRAIEERHVDCVVVYKVDRLSRSLLDFARLMSLFDRHRTSFVSVTQEFNTTTSLGRLTLNILLSFAQFEREIISERTRDKLSAARRKGKWIGGIPVLGYDARAGRLVVNAEEAERVRQIFGICAEQGTLSRTLREINNLGLATKGWTSQGGRRHESRPFTMENLSRLLRNVIYKGCISHKRTVFEGEQEPLIDRALWEQVQQLLAINGRSQRGRPHEKQAALLAGLLRCGMCSVGMIVTSTRRLGRRHTYYVCPTAKQGRCEQRPVAAQDVERCLLERMGEASATEASAFVVQHQVEAVHVDTRTRGVTVALRDGTRMAFVLPIPVRPGSRGDRQGPTRGRVPRVSRLMALAIRLEKLVNEGKLEDYASAAGAGQISRARMSQITSLMNLAPAIQEALLFLPKTTAGPDRITERALRPIARIVEWDAQMQKFQRLMPLAWPTRD